MTHSMIGEIMEVRRSNYHRQLMSEEYCMTVQYSCCCWSDCCCHCSTVQLADDYAEACHF